MPVSLSSTVSSWIDSVTLFSRPAASTPTLFLVSKGMGAFVWSGCACPGPGKPGRLPDQKAKIRCSSRGHPELQRALKKQGEGVKVGQKAVASALTEPTGIIEARREGFWHPNAAAGFEEHVCCCVIRLSVLAQANHAG